jgi:hypothetical protein
VVKFLQKHITKIIVLALLLTAACICKPNLVKAETRPYVQEELGIFTDGNIYGANTPTIALLDGEKNIVTRLQHTLKIDGFLIGTQHLSNMSIIQVEYIGENFNGTINDNFKFSYNAHEVNDMLKVTVETETADAKIPESYYLPIVSLSNCMPNLTATNLIISSADKDKYDANANAFIEKLYANATVYDALGLMDENDVKIIWNGKEIKAQSSTLMKSFKKGNTYCRSR